MGEVTREAIRQWPHHQTPQRRNPREETREVTPQPNLPQRKEREAKRRSHLPRKKARDPRLLRHQIPRDPKKARVRRPRRLLPKAALTERELTANLLMERALTAREPMESLLMARALARDRKMARDQRTAKDQRVPRNGECATVRRSWRHPNVTASTTLLIPGPRLSALPCPWVTSAVSASHHHRPRERMERAKVARTPRA